MLAILYLIFSSFIGYNLMKTFIPRLFNVSKEISLMGKKINLSNWMVTLPAAFLTGTLFSTWFTYLITYGIAVLFSGVERPLLYGNIITFAIFILLTVIFLIKYKEDFKLFFSKFKNIRLSVFINFVLSHKTELIYVLVCLFLWSNLMVRSFNINSKNEMMLGISVFSDFGAHIPMIRSFSEGSNFPTEYPHYSASGSDSITGNNVMYHFMFHFLSGNLEFLGLRIDWAFNLPSILAMMAFLMLLYSLVVLIFGNRLTAVLAAVLFLFRSSFAVFTFTANLKLESPNETGINKYISIVKQYLNIILNNTTNIGKTTHEDWGFYAQKVFVNKRHYIFALGIAMLVLIIVFPLFKQMIIKLRKTRVQAVEKINELELQLNAEEQSIQVEDESIQAQNPIVKPSLTSLRRKLWLDEFILNKDAWMPANVSRSVVAGLLLGLIGFWNGSVVISMLPVLFFMAILSKRRLEYLNIAAISVILVFAQTLFFTWGQISTSSVNLFIGYLAQFPDGINTMAKDYLQQGNYSEFIKLIPDLSYNILLFYLELLGFFLLLLVTSIPFSKKGGRWLTLAFVSPLVIATLFSFSSDVGANHVIIIFSVILLNIIIANMLTKLSVSKNIMVPIFILGLAEVLFYTSSVLFKFEMLFVPANIFALIIAVIVFITVIIVKRKFDIVRAISISVAVILIVAITSSGILDGLVLYNMDKPSTPGRLYSMNNPVINWVEDNTDRKAVFLINPDFLHLVLIAGRSVYLGGAYFVSTAGYDWDKRMRIVKNIYGASDANTLRELIEENEIDYIVIDDSNRHTEDYTLNEDLIKSTFEPVFNDPVSNTQIYKVK